MSHAHGPSGLAGLTDDADRLARTVARANPWLVWWCVSEGRDVEEATRIWVEDRSPRLLLAMSRG